MVCLSIGIPKTRSLFGSKKNWTFPPNLSLGPHLWSCTPLPLPPNRGAIFPFFLAKSRPLFS